MPSPYSLSPYASTRIPAVLLERERTQAWLARKMGMSEAAVSRVISGQNRISWQFVHRACTALSLPESALFVMPDVLHASKDNMRTSNHAEGRAENDFPDIPYLATA